MKKLLSLKSLFFILLIQVFSFSTHSQVRDLYDDDRVFYYDDFGWSLGLSLGTVFYGVRDFNFGSEYDFDGQDEEVEAILLPSTFELKETWIPAFNITAEYKPYKGLSFDTGLGYFQHDIFRSVVQDGPEISIDGSQKTITFFVGGNYYFDNSSVVTPYLSTDFGLATAIVDAKMSAKLLEEDTGTSLDFTIGYLDGWDISPAAQAGVGLRFDLGPVNLGTLYNYIFTDGYMLSLDRTRDSVLEEDIPENFDVNLETNSIGGHNVQLKVEIKPGTLTGN